MKPWCICIPTGTVIPGAAPSGTPAMPKISTFTLPLPGRALGTLHTRLKGHNECESAHYAVAMQMPAYASTVILCTWLQCIARPCMVLSFLWHVLHLHMIRASCCDAHCVNTVNSPKDSSLSLIMPGLLMLNESGLVRKNPIAVIAKCDSLVFSLFLFPDHVVPSAAVQVLKVLCKPGAFLSPAALFTSTLKKAASYRPIP